MLSKIVPALIFAVAFAQVGIAAEEDYASRLKELRDRKADAQIEPLLNEWREKRPNDPEAVDHERELLFQQAPDDDLDQEAGERRFYGDR